MYLSLRVNFTFAGRTMSGGGFLFLRKRKTMKRIFRKILNYNLRRLYEKMSDNAAAIVSYQLFCRR